MPPLFFLAATPSSAGSPFGLLLPLALFGVIIYFLMIRPQQKRQKEHRSMLSALAPGDKVVTIGGIHGTVTSVQEGSIVVRVAENVKLTLSLQAISHRLQKQT